MSAPFTATSAELSLVSQIFTRAGQQKLGILSGDIAVQVFNGAKLPGSVLGEIWNIADEENNGWLSKTGVAKALRLISHAQNGENMSAALLSKPAPLPTIDGYSFIPQQATGSSIAMSPSLNFPPFSPQDKTKFQNIFNRSGPLNGLLNGDKARDIFLKSKLPNDRLLQIWNLADTRNRGALDITDFAIAMYFIQGLMTQKISFVPTSLPPGLYEQAGGSLPSVATHLSGNAGSFSPVSGNFSQIQPQTTGQSQPLSPSHSGFIPQRRTPVVPARPSHGGHDAWDVTPTEKAEADAIFDGELDTKKVGFIEGEAAVPFMLKSQLPGEDLAQIWDLADINSDGRLNRDGFAIAYHLIKNKLRGQPIPTQLPQSLIPPSLRPQTNFFQTSPQTLPEPPRDLLDFDDTPPPSAVSPQIISNLPVLRPQSTGATAVPPIPPRNVVSDPFASSPFTSSAANNDLLGDHDLRQQTTSPLQDQSAELGNARNQLQSTNKSLDAAKAERAKLESTLASQAAELSAVQTQLSSAKAAYDTESTLLAQLKERHAAQTSEIQKSREDLIRSESDLSAIRVEKAEIEQAFLRDKEEARDLHRRMIETGQQADELKLEVEKSKKEAKQQKGRLAIARKQLLTKETEKAKVEKELDEANAELKSIEQEIHGVENQLIVEAPQPKRATSPDSIAIAAAQPLPASPELLPPSKSNNPFERLAIPSGSPSPRSQSPFVSLDAGLTSSPIGPMEEQTKRATPEPKSSFDDFFGVDDSNTNQEESKSTEANGDAASREADGASPTTVTDTDHFVTPPSTAKPETLSDTAENFADIATARFPSIDGQPPASDDAETEMKQDGVHTVTGLDTNLQEVEVEESDSDESDDDHKPLSEVAQEAKQRRSLALDHSANAHVTTEQNGQPPGPAKDSFDNIFGSSSIPASQGVSTSEAPKIVPGTSDFLTTAQPSETTKQNVTADVNAFDETLSGFSSPSPPVPGQFTFDTFEDSFDFGAAVGTQPDPSSPSVVEPSASKTPAAPTNQAASNNFDDLFGSPNANNATQSTPMSNGVSPQVEPPKPISFDDAFASFDASPNLNLEPSLGHGVPTGSRASTSTGVQSPKPFSSPSGPTSPRAGDSVSSRRSMHSMTSPRPGSPPARTGSPNPRPSTSSKDSHEKKDTATKSSKLSIRFPFGKKRNKSANAESLPPAPLLSPPMEDLNRTVTPASEDDVEAVKQITAMGFSRSQAVEALEKYGYDVQRATNNLLQ